MPEDEAGNLLDRGIKALREGNCPSALRFFERAAALDPNPTVNSYLAFSIARERGQIKKAIELCTEAVEKEPENPVLYLNLGRVHLIAKRRQDAIKAFRDGLSRERLQEIIDEMNRIGIRRKPVFPFLKRSNPLNKYLGYVLSRLGGKRS